MSIQKLTRAALVSILLISLMTQAAHASDYTDITDHWAKEFIDIADAHNIIEGYGDLTFKPNNHITRGELFKVICRCILSVEDIDYMYHALEDGAPVFSDLIVGDPYTKYVLVLHSLGKLMGYEDGTIRTDKSITRQEAFVLLYRLLKEEELAAAESDPLASFLDKDEIPAWSKTAISELVKMGIVEGSDKYIRPKDNLTRAEAVKLVVLSLIPTEEELPPEPSPEISPEPSEEPSPELTEEPSPELTEEPSPELTEEPTPEPSEEPPVTTPRRPRTSRRPTSTIQVL